jgi:histidinol dehydrogenase
MTRFLRFTGRICDLSAADRDALFDRTARIEESLGERVASIIADVRRRGDKALCEMARDFDGVALESLEVPRDRLTRALDELNPQLRRAMERARDNIAAVHRAFAPTCAEFEPEPGIVIGRRPDPLQCVGVYAPGGRAAYPSSVLMGAVAARVAGVDEVILCSPPGGSGAPSDVVLAAAALAGVDRVFAVGGAGAIAAMALGTQSVPRVDRVVGPGNAFVSIAKAQLAGVVGIDSPAGPSELLIVADDVATARDVAIELVAQAEHDPNACVVAVIVGDAFARDVERELRIAARATPRAEIAAAALRGQGAILVARDPDEAVAFANSYAPEHLWLVTHDDAAAVSRVRSAGTVFIGREASVAFGDYMSGANHVLPTGGAARAYSGLSPLDFVRWTTYQRFTESAARRLADDVAVFADAESLPGHAAAARRWSSRQ